MFQSDKSGMNLQNKDWEIDGTVCTQNRVNPGESANKLLLSCIYYHPCEGTLFSEINIVFSGIKYEKLQQNSNIFWIYFCLLGLSLGHTVESRQSSR